jgi:hypothetical protein
MTITITDQHEIEEGDMVSLTMGDTAATGRTVRVDAQNDPEGRYVRGVSIAGIGWAYFEPGVVVQQRGLWQFVSAFREVPEVTVPDNARAAELIRFHLQGADIDVGPGDRAELLAFADYLDAKPVAGLNPNTEHGVRCGNPSCDC